MSPPARPLLLIDNYDSFVFNLARYFIELGQIVEVVRNDAMTIDQIQQFNPTAIVISPGPCGPAEAGVSLEIVRQLHRTIPILGVCLGHQVIGAAFGCPVIRAATPIHGKSSLVHHTGEGLFKGLPDPFRAGRYHSLIVPSNKLGPELKPTAWTADGTLMGLAHQTSPTFGVQFHPESILTEGGRRILHNFLSLAGLSPVDPTANSLINPEWIQPLTTENESSLAHPRPAFW